MAGPARYAADRLTAAHEDLVRRYPAFAATAAVDELRATDYARLDRLGHTYLDYTGGGLYAESQLRRHRELLAASVLGNPHSQNPTSVASAELARQARDAVRRFFNAPEDEFEIVFTANASGALKLVGESYPFAPGGVFLLSYDNHNSVNGIREFAARRGAAVSYIPVREDDLRLDEEQVRTALRGAGDGAAKLFAYPAQSNFSGAQHPLEWVDEPPQGARARKQRKDHPHDPARHPPRRLSSRTRRRRHRSRRRGGDRPAAGEGRHRGPRDRRRRA